MKKFSWLIVFVTAVLLIAQPTAHTAPQQNSTEPSITTMPDGVLLHWSVPSVQHYSDNVQAVHFDIPAYQQSADPGQFALPVQAALIAVPTNADLTVEIQNVRQTTHELPGPVAVAPEPSGVVRDANGEAIGGDFKPVANPQPAMPSLVQLHEAGTVRGVRLVRVLFTPVRPINASSYVAAQEATVLVGFHTPAGAAAQTQFRQTDARSDKLLQAVQSLVVNPQQVGEMQAMPRQMQAAPTLAETATAPVLAVEVAEDGITAVTYADLSAAGFPVASVNPKKLHLQRAGAEIPFEWDGDADAKFEQNERILFYAAPRTSRWMHGDVYLLYGDGTDGLRMDTQAVATPTAQAGNVWIEQLVEQNELYTPDCLCGSLPFGRDGDRWVWDFFNPDPQFQERTYAVTLPTVKTSVDAEITLWFIGYTSVAQNPDHQVDVAWNGTDIGSVTWDGKTAVTTTLTIPAAKLQTNNSMTLSLVNPNGVTVNGVWFDAAQVRYARNGAQTGSTVAFSGSSAVRKYTVGLANTTDLRIYDVTDSEMPKRLTGLSPAAKSVTFEPAVGGQHVYSVANSSGIKSPDAVRRLTSLQNAAGADYILIAPDAFMAAANTLKSLRQSQGLQVVVEDVQAIYDQFGDGVPTPDAIHDYLAMAYTTWNPVPQYVLLMGDGSFDPKQYRGASTPTWIAPFFMEADPWIGEVPVDNRFVTFDGGYADYFPDMMIGRLPVNSLQDAQTVADKIVAYETTPEFGPWAGRITFVADNPDNAGDFAYHSNSLIGEFIDPPWLPQRIFYDPPNNTLLETIDGVQDQWAAGSGIWFYNGHSSRYQWAAERIFHAEDVPNLSNGARLPVMLQMTCLTGSYHIPDLITLDESLLTQENGGVVAVWGATGLGVATGHHELSSGFLQTVVVDQNPVMGQATLAGKLNLMNFHRDLIDTFTLLGDPYLQVYLDIPTDYVYLPMIAR